MTIANSRRVAALNRVEAMMRLEHFDFGRIGKETPHMKFVHAVELIVRIHESGLMSLMRCCKGLKSEGKVVTELWGRIASLHQWAGAIINPGWAGLGNRFTLPVAKWLVVKLDNTHSSGETRLMRCLGAGDRTIASSLALNLIKAGVFVNSQSNEGLTALMLATERHEVAIIRALLDAKANLEDQNVDGDTALILAARKGWSDTISILLNAKANVNVWNRRGELPLHLACAHGDSAGIQALLNAKAKPEIFCCGRTALCWALISQQGANMITLLNGKAAVNTLPPGGYTVTDLASQNGLTDVIKLFRQYGGKTRDELERT